jgi:hypothetical protein
VVKRLIVMVVLTALTVPALAAGYWLYVMMIEPGRKNSYVFAHNYTLSKHGLGIIRENLFVETDPPINELLLGKGNLWMGNVSTTKEAVIFFEDKVWPPSALPDDFDLSKAVVISFEGGRVRFFDFRRMRGGYYERPGVK